MKTLIKAVLGQLGWMRKASKDVLIVIPARLNSHRLPGKVLLPICGKPMVCHVYDACIRAGFSRDQVIVAVDHYTISEALNKHNVPSILTSPFHNSGTDRVLEACKKMGVTDDTVVLNIQGDEPEIDPSLINQLANATKLGGADIVTMKTAIHNASDTHSVNIVKVVTDVNNKAMLFSRAAIPFIRNTVDDFKYYRHVGIYGYTVKSLKKFSKLPMSILEKTEGLEQLRAMENGMTIKAITAAVAPPHGVDTEDDYAKAVERMESKDAF